MRDFDQFWTQLLSFLEKHGVALLSATLIGGLTLGFILNQFFNVGPMKKALANEMLLKEQEAEISCEEECEMPLYSPGDGKKIGVVKGMINKEVVKNLRRRRSHNKSERSQPVAKEDIVVERRHLLEEDCSRDDVNTDENSCDDSTEEEETPVRQGQRDRASFQSEGSENADEANVLGALGPLHGKLATAQLRARTRKMQLDMTEEERQSEAEMKARQLDSIMALMMQNKDKFGMETDDVNEQLNLYNF